MQDRILTEDVMGQRIRIRLGEVEVVADLDDTPTARRLLSALPCESTAATWGEEVYFEVPVRARLEESARQVVDPGSVCFWVEGASLAIPFGPTPVSRGSECRLVTKCNLLGHIDGDPRVLASVGAGDRIRIELAVAR